VDLINVRRVWESFDYSSFLHRHERTHPGEKLEIVRWVTPIILATWKADIGRIVV
jgi:hypothetical protein